MFALLTLDKIVSEKKNKTKKTGALYCISQAFTSLVCSGSAKCCST